MKIGAPADLLDWLKPGAKVYLQGGPGECSAFVDLLMANPGAAEGVELWSCLVPGINTFDYAGLPAGPRLVTFMASPALAPSIAAGRTSVHAMPYSAIGATLLETRFDLAILHAAPPDADGHCSFGVACDAPAIAAARAGKRVAFLNARMPRIPNSEGIAAGSLDMAVPIDAPLLSPPPARQRSAVLASLARNAAALVPDSAVIQSGIGEAPAAVVAALADRKGLQVHSGIITPEYRLLADAGALDPDAQHVTGIAWGDAGFYEWLNGNATFAFRSIQETHSRERLALLPTFTSVGSAVEVDLAGAVNLEWRGGRRISSVGGAPDYMHAARASEGGRSIIVLPSTARNGASRIVAHLEGESVGAELADWVVTEHGAAHLRGKSAEARAEAMIAVAAPQHRDKLSDDAGRD